MSVHDFRFVTERGLKARIPPKKAQRSLLSVFSLLSALVFLNLAPTEAAGPNFVNIVQTVQSQPIKNAKLVYWDQALADELGIKVPPGRVGQVEFEAAVVKRLAFEVKAAKQGHKAELLRANYALDGTPFMFVENDPFGGSGRAAYIQVGQDAWVNIKGVGRTGAGNAKGVISPPESVFSSHKDGSATLEEAIKEAIMARVADSETKTGSSRVLGILYTGRTIEYEGGRKVPLALIIRAPLRRFDQGEVKKSVVADALAHANSARLMKGDFVNSANMGSHGEFVDFGCMTHTCGFAPLASSQSEYYLFEGKRFLSPTLLTRKLGENVFLQLGIPEAHLEALGLSTKENAKRFENIGSAFQKLVYNDPQRTLLDFAPVPKEKLIGQLKLHELFRDLAGDFYLKPQTQEEFVTAQLARALQNTPQASQESRTHLKSFLEDVYRVLVDVRNANDIDKWYPEYSAKVRTVAQFKNREITEIVRPNLFSSTGPVADRFAADLNPDAVQDFIDNTVLSSRFGTLPAADANIIAHAHSKTTELFIRSYKDDQEVNRLFSHPELTGAAKNEKFYFRVSSDGWKTFTDLEAEATSTKVGDYFKLVLPHDQFPLTWERVQLSPFVKTEAGETRWLASNFNIRGPPLVFNERLGLPSSFEKRPGALRSRYGRPITFMTEDLDNQKIVYNSQFFVRLFEKFNDPAPEVAADSVEDFQFHKKDFLDLYFRDNSFKEYIQKLATGENKAFPSNVRNLVNSTLPVSECKSFVRKLFRSFLEN